MRFGGESRAEAGLSRAGLSRRRSLSEKIVGLSFRLVRGRAGSDTGRAKMLFLALPRRVTWQHRSVPPAVAGGSEPRVSSSQRIAHPPATAGGTDLLLAR